MKRLPEADLDAAIVLSEDCLRSLHGARLFLTGCTGFVGVWILDTVLRARHRLGLDIDLTVLSRNPDLFLSRFPWFVNTARLRFVRGDVSAFAHPEGDFSHVVHGATTAAHETFGGAHPMCKFDTVADGTRRVLEFCREKGVQDMLFISSGAVYGKRPAEAGLIHEADLIAPDALDADSALGEAKRVAELFCAIQSTTMDLRVRIARCFSFVGPLLPLDIHYAIGNFLADAIGGRAITLKGDGRPTRSYLYASDLVAWLITILVNGTPLRAYNVGSEDGRTLLEIASIVGRLTGLPVLRPPSPAAGPATSAGDQYVPATIRARKELELRQTVSLEDGVRKTLAYYR